MKVQVLFSTSDGNACRIFNGNNSILLDCGVSLKKMFKNGKFNVDAVFVSHEHYDHVQGTGIIGRATGSPIYIHQGTYSKIVNKNRDLLKGCNIKYIFVEEPITVGDFKIFPWKTSHDCLFGMFFTILEKSTGVRFGLLTDTGKYTDHISFALKKCDAMLLEMNYDENLLCKYKGYSKKTKDRIRSDTGHLSNTQTISFIQDSLDLIKIQWITFGHLSPRTNTVDIVMNSVCETFPDYKNFYVSPSTSVFEIHKKDGIINCRERRIKDYVYIQPPSKLKSSNYWNNNLEEDIKKYNIMTVQNIHRYHTNKHMVGICLGGIAGGIIGIILGSFPIGTIIGGIIGWIKSKE